MTRPKVDPEKRQRTAQACDACKRRKQKCNGLQPCNTCSKRNSPCTYGTAESKPDEPQPSKRRMTDQYGSSLATSLNRTTEAKSQLPRSPYMPQTQQWVSKQELPAQTSNRPTEAGTSSIKGPAKQYDGVFVDHTLEEQENKKRGLDVPAPENQLLSRGTSTSGQDEEAIVESNPRLLEDPTGRVLYIGDSATLSFLQLIRTYVESVAGSGNPFIMDPRRLKIVENTITLPPNIRRTHLLPDRQTANVLVDSFFTNTNGLIEVFPRKAFFASLEKCYTDPLNVDPSWLCLLHLTFAIGLVMAAPQPGTPEDAIIQKLRSEVSIGSDGKVHPVDRAAVFYLDAKHLSDPSTGFEDAGFWSIQALTLISVYMLAVSKRNAAYAYSGMALRSAFALGLHRAETMVIFSRAEQTVRRNLWRSLYVLDRFLSASLGRPTAIRDSDCSGDPLISGEKPPFHQATFTSATDSTDGLGLEASVRSCRTIGVILDKVYSQRKISTKLAQGIADHCKGWPKTLDPSLHPSQSTRVNPADGIATLHVYLFHCHSVVLLTRPFFLFAMNKKEQERREIGAKQQGVGSRMDRFGEACVSASCQSITLVQQALEGGYLPRRNPFVIYFLFASALVVLSSQFSDLYPHVTPDSSVSNAINLMRYCAEHDPQASRLHFILTSFRNLVVQQRATVPQNLNPDTESQMRSQPMSLSNENNIPMGDVYLSSTTPGGTSAIPAPGQPPNSSISPHPLAPTDLPSPAQSSDKARDAKMDAPGLLDRLDGHSSWDTFFDLARSDGNESLGGDAEIDFEMLWQWPNSNGAGLTTPGGNGMTTPGGLGMPGIGPDVQSISDSAVPMYGFRTDVL